MIGSGRLETGVAVVVVVVVVVVVGSSKENALEPGAHCDKQGQRASS